MLYDSDERPRPDTAGAPSLLRSAGRTGHNERNNEPVQNQRLGEDKDKDHADEQLRLLGGGTDTGVADNANRSASGKSNQMRVSASAIRSG